jgi:hypothetical protein
MEIRHMEQLYIVRFGDSYERFIVGVGRSEAEAVRLADDHCAQFPSVQEGHYGYLVVPVGQAIDWEGLETPIYDEEVDAG